jgi:hypothetical protein
MIELFKINKFLIIKAKYDVVEPYYMDGSTSDQLAKNIEERAIMQI